MPIILGICLLLFFGAEAPVFGAGAPPAKIVITPASFSEREGLLIVSQNQGFFRKYKLDVELVLMPNAPIAFSALTAGESHFYYGTTSGTSLGAVLNGLDGVFVAGFINKLIGAFSVTKDIKTPNDLKGKQIGVASLGGGNWMFTMLAFDHWGLDPKRDNITFRSSAIPAYARSPSHRESSAARFWVTLLRPICAVRVIRFWPISPISTFLFWIRDCTRARVLSHNIRISSKTCYAPCSRGLRLFKIRKTKVPC